MSNAISVQLAASPSLKQERPLHSALCSASSALPIAFPIALPISCTASCASTACNCVQLRPCSQLSPAARPSGAPSRRFGKLVHWQASELTGRSSSTHSAGELASWPDSKAARQRGSRAARRPLLVSGTSDRPSGSHAKGAVGARFAA